MLNLLPAAIDIGSHSSILLIADWNIGPGGKKIPQPKVQKIEVCRLGEDIYDSGEISRKRLEELVNILTRFRMTAHGLGASIEAVAMTEAMRQAVADNPESLLHHQHGVESLGGEDQEQ